MSIAQYFHKVKSICHEISKVQQKTTTGETRIKRIIIHGLISKCRNFVTEVQGWKVQPSLIKFESMCARQQTMAKQMGGVS